MPAGSRLRRYRVIAFYNERVDIVLDGERLDRPLTPYSADA